jgi:hypothetical protein
MRRYAIAFAGIVIAAIAATAALAGTVKLQGTYTQGQIDLACLNAGGTVTWDKGSPGAYGCKTDKGEVNCTKDGECYGYCEKCGTQTRLAGTSKRQLLGGILANSLPSLSQPGGTLQQVQRPVGGAGSGWSAECKSCLDKCDADYPGGGGPLQTCKQLCKTAGTCPARLGIEAGGGVTPPSTRY